jgi:hypothetical protein
VKPSILEETPAEENNEQVPSNTERPKAVGMEARTRTPAQTIGRKRAVFRDQLTALFHDTPRENEGPDEAERRMARTFFQQYLQENVEASETIMDMREIIDEFRMRAPHMIVLKCIDGRVHGSKGKGYPPTTVDFFRTEGSKLNNAIGNMAFWKRMDRKAIDATRNTPGMPALFIALAHTGDEGHGCAAQSKDADGNPIPDKELVRSNSLQTVAEHAEAVRKQYAPDQVYALHGMTNTDDMSEHLIFEDGTELDTAAIIDDIGTLTNPSDIFTEEFLDQPIPDAALRRHTGERTVRELLEGNDAPLYRDLETAIAMEAFLMREISSSAQSGKNSIVNPAVFQAVDDTLAKVDGLPDSLRGPLLYQTIWNVAYTLYQRNRLALMSEGEEKEEHLEHAETLVCYGEGFELLPRNRAVLAKTGRGDDREALRVAKAVLEGNRKKRPQQHKPVVHINVETTGALDGWDAFNAQVLSRLAAMTREVYDVFGTDVHIMTTYSHQNEKRFYPVQTFQATPSRPQDPRLSFPVDLSVGLNERTFTRELDRRQTEYADEMFAARSGQEEEQEQPEQVSVTDDPLNFIHAYIQDGDGDARIKAPFPPLGTADVPVTVEGDLTGKIREALAALRRKERITDDGQWKSRLGAIAAYALTMKSACDAFAKSDHVINMPIVARIRKLMEFIPGLRGRAREDQEGSAWMAASGALMDTLLQVINEELRS